MQRLWKQFMWNCISQTIWLWMLWDSKAVWPIVVDITMFNPKQQFLLIGLYNEPRVVDKRTQFWVFFKSTHVFPTKPWIVMGDYYQIFSPKEKLDGASPNMGLLLHCKSIIVEFQLLDLGYKGHHFTWYRGNTHERLDRAMGNFMWSQQFRNIVVYHLLYLHISNHCPLILQTDTSHTQQKGRKD